MKKYNSKAPLFFLFTCVKNGNRYINKLFDCLINQTKVNFLHFIYEDGSTEPLGDLIDDYKNRVSKLSEPYKVVYEFNPVNIGLIKSTQYCISKCNCPYFIWIDCDNYVDIHFFEEMEKLYYRHKNALLLRSFFYFKKEDEDELHCEWHKFKTANNKYQLGIYIRKKYFYSFFAVNYKKYSLLNPNNIMINNRVFYNDEQVLIICLLNTVKAPITKKAISYFLVHDGQESSQYKINDEERKEYHLKLCGLINSKFKSKLEALYHIKDLYDELIKLYKYDFKKSVKIIKEIKALSKKNNVSLKNFYDSNLTKYLLRAYYWRIKK